jgi:glycerophosphoryl diester phosphodiesterase
MIELDVRLTKDEEVIVLHDRTLQRTTTGNGLARKFTLATIASYDAGSWFDPQFNSERVPTLLSVLQLVRDSLWVNIEIKSDPLRREPWGLSERKVLEVVEKSGMNRSVLISSFDHDLIANVKHISPSSNTGLLYNFLRNYGQSPSKLAKRAGASAFICSKQELTRSMIDDAHRHNIAVYVYTLNSIQGAKKMIQAGVDGIMSDNADEIVGLVKGIQEEN